MKLLLLNGPNLNLLGSREPGIYGADTLASIEQRAAEVAREAGHELVAFQSNAEHELIDRIHAARRPRHRLHHLQSRRLHAHQRRAARRAARA